jgi:DNA polymerase
MSKITLDFESRAVKEVELKSVGVFPYAAHPKTEILCIAAKPEGKDPFIWVPPGFELILPDNHSLPLVSLDHLIQEIMYADIVEAHNASFEYSMWHSIMVPRYHAPEIEPRKWRCSAAKASSFNLPRALGNACSALDLAQQKDNLGYQIMLKMCKPRKPTKHNTAEWHEDPQEFEILCQYCIQDVVSEEALSDSLPELPQAEQELWFLDQTINRRGIKVDIPAIDNLINKIDKREAELLLELQTLTTGTVKSARQVGALCAWICSKGVQCDNLKKENVPALIELKLPKEVRRALEIRQSLGKSSVSKLTSMKNRAGKDDRVRVTLIYHGASTGRWSGFGIQPQNYPRNTLTEEEIEEVLELEPELLEVFYGDTFATASKCLRGMLIPDEGKKLIACDYASIEARVLAWVAGEEHILEAYRNGADTYIMNAMDFFGVTQDKVTKDMRQIGKVVELSSGYQGWVNAFNAMARGYGIDIDEDKSKEFIGKWRRNRPATVALWKGLENAAIEAVKTGKPVSYGRIKFGVRGRFLHMRLPSGRLLSYCDPHIRPKEVHGKTKDCLAFMGVDSTTKRWVAQYTYGGSLCENAVQAISRCLLVNSMHILEKEGYPIVMHVHDEVVCEVPNNYGSVKAVENIMRVLPAWAIGLPIDCEGWEGKRYRK